MTEVRSMIVLDNNVTLVFVGFRFSIDSSFSALFCECSKKLIQRFPHSRPLFTSSARLLQPLRSVISCSLYKKAANGKARHSFMVTMKPTMLTLLFIVAVFASRRAEALPAFIDDESNDEIGEKVTTVRALLVDNEDDKSEERKEVSLHCDLYRNRLFRT